MKRMIILLLSVLVVVFFTGNALGAIYTIEAEGLPVPSEIESLALFFDVGNDFIYTPNSLVLGPDIPQNQPLDTLWPWTFADSNPAVSALTFKVDMYNSDAFDFTPIPSLADGVYNENNLVNGILASFEYTGTISLDTFVVGNNIGNPISYELFSMEKPGGVVISAVPIPSALLLFGGGLLGMLGIRRKNKK